VYYSKKIKANVYNRDSPYAYVIYIFFYKRDEHFKEKSVLHNFGIEKMM
jgi:hypothetical protein